MEKYGLTLAKYDGNSYYTSSLSNATHIVYYGDGALIHAEALPTNKPNAARKFFDEAYSHVQTVNIGDLPSKKRDDLEGKVFKSISKGLPIPKLTEQKDWLNQKI